MNIGRFLGTPYEEMDCYELVRAIYRTEFDIELPILTRERQMVCDWHLVPMGDHEQVGDVIVFKMGTLKRHLGVVVDPSKGTMIHTEERINCCQARYRSPEWVNRIQKIYRHSQLS